MGRAYSDDLREKVLAAYAAGKGTLQDLERIQDCCTPKELRHSERSEEPLYFYFGRARLAVHPPCMRTKRPPAESRWVRPQPPFPVARSAPLRYMHRSHGDREFCAAAYEDDFIHIMRPI
jgi:hypothetical protein